MAFLYKLLIVDDEPIIREGIKELVDLRSLGIDRVFEAKDGREALLVVQEQNPDIVLTDINMPNMDGLQLTGAIKEINPKIRVVGITGYDYFDYAVTALKSGVEDYLLKPVSRNDIRELLQKIIGRISEEEAQIRAIKLLENLNASHSQEENPIEYREKILQILDKQVGNSDFSLVELAKAVGLSSGYLSSLFKQIFGIPFQDYLLNIRMERAKIMLLSSALKVYEVALKLGFDDPNYFSSSFKKRYGKTPNQFRVNPKGGEDENLA